MGQEYLIGASEILLPSSQEKMKLLFYFKERDIICNISIVHNLDQSKQLSLYYQASDSKSLVDKSRSIDKKDSVISYKLLAGMDKQGNIAASFTNQMVVVIT